MYIRTGGDEGLARLLRDPLIRLVMDSDNVTEEAMIALIQQLRRSLAAREADVGREAGKGMMPPRSRRLA